MSQNDFERQCHECGGTYELITQPGVFLYRGAEIPVEESFFRCSECGEERVTWEQAGAKEALAAAKYREMERLLSPERIRSIRDQALGLTQAVFERVLRLGEKTAARWEGGRVLQNRATDHLFRLLERDPTALAFLAEQMGTLEELPHPVRNSSDWRPLLPYTLAQKIKRNAEREGVLPDVYLTMLLMEQVTTEAVCTEVQKLHDTLLSMHREWKRNSLRLDDREPWKRDYDQNQSERGYAEAA